MHKEIIYLFIAFFASVGILFHYGWKSVKLMLDQQIEAMKEEFDRLNTDLEDSNKCFIDIQTKYLNKKDKNLLLLNSLPNLLKEQHKKYEEKNIIMIKEYKTWCEQHYIAEYKHKEEISFKQIIIDRIVKEVEKMLLINSMDVSSNTWELVLKEYKKYARIE